MLSGLDIFSLAAIVFLGVPHGALDYVLISNMGNKIAYTTLITVFLYSIITLLAIIFWFLYPTLALFLFLAASTIHFGIANSLSIDLSATRSKLVMLASTIAQGGFITIYLPFGHWETVSGLFSVLGSDSDFIWLCLQAGFYAWIASVGILLVYLCSTKDIKGLFCLLVAGSIVFTFPPLFSFALYFCCLHSFIHYRRVMISQLGSSAFPPMSFIFLTVLAWSLMIIVGFGAGHNDFYKLADEIQNALVRGVFISLFALTVPHMVIVDLIIPKYKNLVLVR
ncbi:Brp/Blh family beta-carotene 15,15'-dioxygenase [Gammaproteobacteria bacterium]|nr:Brp/Blh family beta-carotene 15,15'-dioxygenase [Gammaproteobacteria bacterium]